MENLAIIICTIVSGAFTGCPDNHSTVSAVQDTVLVSDTIQYHACIQDKDIFFLGMCF